MATKQRIQLSPHPRPAGFAGPFGTPGTVQVIDEKPGQVTAIDKAKGYYKGIIAMAGIILMALSQAALPEPAAGWATAVVAVLTPLLTVLKANEQWVDSL